MDKLKMKNGIELIAEERQRQIEVKGYNKEHDLNHKLYELIDAAIAYAEMANIEYDIKTKGLHQEVIEQRMYSVKRLVYPQSWNPESLKPTTDIRDLVKAGALIAAAIDRLQNENVK